MAGRIRDCDRAASLLGPGAGWPQRLRKAVDMVLAVPGPANVLWGAVHVWMCDDADIAVTKGRHPATLGGPAAEDRSELQAEVPTPLLEAAFEGRAMRLADLSFAFRSHAGRVEERTFDSTWSPIPDGSRSVEGASEILVEVTARRRAEAGLRESEARQRFSNRLRNVLQLLQRDGRVLSAGGHCRSKRFGHPRVDDASDPRAGIAW